MFEVKSKLGTHWLLPDNEEQRNGLSDRNGSVHQFGHQWCKHNEDKNRQ
jgi:hypothetical protein